MTVKYSQGYFCDVSPATCGGSRLSRSLITFAAPDSMRFLSSQVLEPTMVLAEQHGEWAESLPRTGRPQQIPGRSELTDRTGGHPSGTDPPTTKPRNHTTTSYTTCRDLTELPPHHANPTTGTGDGEISVRLRCDVTQPMSARVLSSSDEWHPKQRRGRTAGWLRVSQR
jgi:hypothetical protein